MALPSRNVLHYIDWMYRPQKNQHFSLQIYHLKDQQKTLRLEPKQLALSAYTQQLIARLLEMLHYPDQFHTKGNHAALDRIPMRSHAPS
jgi:hypothetical protein